MRKILVMLAFSALCSGNAVAGEDAFTKGPVFTEFGPVADVATTFAIPTGAAFRHSFDVSKPAADGEPNRTLVSAARFINMHARAGVAAEDIHVAVVVHGAAVRDVARAGSGAGSAGSELVAALTEKGVRIIVCGQSAAYYDVATGHLLPGVEMALSAMTAHALLQQRGYTVNPF